MANDYDVFQPSNEGLAQVIVGILNERGYFASYQLGYPNNKVFIKVNTKEEANKISRILKKVILKQKYSGTGIPTNKLDELTSKLMELIPRTFEREGMELLSENNLQNTTDDSPVVTPKVQAQDSVDLEELKSLITNRIEFLNAQIIKHRRDRGNKMRTVEINTLNWVLKNMP
jgi:hypothetical protein